jgi:protoheme IX farnesyltransferase
MLPVTHGERVTKNFIVAYTLMLIAVSVAPFFIGMTGVLYLLGALALGIGFLAYAVSLKRSTDNREGMGTFAFSISYLIALFSFLLVDHYVTLFWPA